MPRPSIASPTTWGARLLSLCARFLDCAIFASDAVAGATLLAAYRRSESKLQVASLAVVAYVLGTRYLDRIRFLPTMFRLTGTMRGLLGVFGPGLARRSTPGHHFQNMCGLKVSEAEAIAAEHGTMRAAYQQAWRVASVAHLGLNGGFGMVLPLLLTLLAAPGELALPGTRPAAWAAVLLLTLRGCHAPVPEALLSPRVWIAKTAANAAAAARLTSVVFLVAAAGPSDGWRLVAVVTLAAAVQGRAPLARLLMLDPLGAVFAVDHPTVRFSDRVADAALFSYLNDGAVPVVERRWRLHVMLHFREAAGLIPLAIGDEKMSDEDAAAAGVTWRSKEAAGDALPAPASAVELVVAHLLPPSVPAKGGVAALLLALLYQAGVAAAVVAQAAPLLLNPGPLAAEASAACGVSAAVVVAAWCAVVPQLPTVLAAMRYRRLVVNGKRPWAALDHSRPEAQRRVAAALAVANVVTAAAAMPREVVPPLVMKYAVVPWCTATGDDPVRSK